MEVIDYDHPQSWDDKGMDWDNPDPRRADYMMALRDAFLERMCAPQDGYYAYGHDVVRMSPWKAVSAESLRQIIVRLEFLCGYYYTLDPKHYREDLSDFPRRMTLRDIVSEEDCETFMNASTGALLDNGGAWLRKIRGAINQLHVVQCHGASGTTLSRSGAAHDPPFAESISKAMAQAFGEGQPMEGVFTKVPTLIFAWSGNTHWKCPRPDWQGEPEENVDGYCGHAQAVAYRFTRIRRWLAGRECDLVVAAKIGAPTGAVPLAGELTTSVFDPGGSGFAEGLNIVRGHVADPLDFELTVGDVGSIPQNAVVPASDFDAEGNGVYYRSAKRGWQGRIWTFLDYECENGFRFRAGAGKKED